jgi:hypothetical protein
MIVRNVPLMSFIAVPMFVVSKETTTIVTRGFFIVANRITGIRWDQPGFTPSFEFIEDLGYAQELFRSNSGAPHLWPKGTLLCLILGYSCLIISIGKCLWSWISGLNFHRSIPTDRWGLCLSFSKTSPKQGPKQRIRQSHGAPFSGPNSACA